MIKNNPIMEAIYAAFQLEIANQFTLTNNALHVVLPNQQTLVITAHQVGHRNAQSLQPTFIPQTHTYHYQHNLNARTNATSARLTLHNLEECRIYLDDVCHNLINATVHDCELTLPDGTIYLLTVTRLK